MIDLASTYSELKNRPELVKLLNKNRKFRKIFFRELASIKEVVPLIYHAQSGGKVLKLLYETAISLIRSFEQQFIDTGLKYQKGFNQSISAFREVYTNSLKQIASLRKDNPISEKKKEPIKRKVIKTSKEDVMVKINGKTYRCECGCNVFRWISDTKLKCNSCEATYTGEK